MRIVGHLAPESTWALGRQVHDFHELIILAAGRMHVRVGGQRYTANAGDVLFYRAGVEHEERTDPVQVMDMHFVSFSGALPADLPVQLHDHEGRLRPLVQWLHTEWHAGLPTARATALGFFSALLAEWQRLARQREHPLVAEFRQLVRRRLTRRWSLDELARTLGMSKYHFIRRYRALAGRTPMEEVRALRLAHAQHLLTTTDLPLKQIPRQAGLGDQYQMCRLFRRHLQMTPGMIRASLHQRGRAR